MVDFFSCELSSQLLKEVVVIVVVDFHAQHLSKMKGKVVSAVSGHVARWADGQTGRRAGRQAGRWAGG